MINEVIQKLKEIGFSEKTFGETVAFFIINNTVYTMGLGLKLLPDSLYCRIFKGSAVYKVIKEGKVGGIACRICLTHDPVVFYKAIIHKEALISCFKDDECFRGICDAYIDAVVEKLVDNEDFIELFMNPLSVEIIRRSPRVFTRASAAIVEALVWLTKIPYLEDYQKRKVIEFISMLRDTVYRSTSDDVLRGIVEEIYCRAKGYLERDASRLDHG